MSSFQLSQPHMSMSVNEPGGDDFPLTIEHFRQCMRSNIEMDLCDFVGFNEEVRFDRIDMVVGIVYENNSSLQKKRLGHRGE